MVEEWQHYGRAFSPAASNTPIYLHRDDGIRNIVEIGIMHTIDKINEEFEIFVGF